MKAEFYRRSRTSEGFGFVADWTQALNERVDFAEVLRRLMRLVNADAVMITRVSISDHKTKYIARCDADAGKVWPSRSQSCADLLLGDSLSTARAGSIWKLSEARSPDQAALRLSVETAFDHLVEAIVCPLETSRGHTDTLELHYRHRPASHDLDLVTMLIETLSTGWHRRVPGFASKTLNRTLKYRKAPTHDDADKAILCTDNPARLSRCEFRVCSLLKEGMTVNVIAKYLAVCPATVRSHLSSIFAKTGTSSQVELLHRLNRESPTASRARAS